jgi:DNA-binding response OmpR family regulator
MNELRKEDSPRLAILDWVMPGMDGVEICGKVRDTLDANELKVRLKGACRTLEQMRD